ncbi:MAG: glycosyltransferase family 2 protein [Balneolaceae bacterium]|nr:MAG: glycosyltransferase family 2 protein [Balneolaceae bacterium]
MKQPLVTIGIPTWNRAGSYLRGAVESALTQSWQNIEVLVSDNGSTDHTAELMADFDDPRLRYIQQPVNLGQRGNMNFLVQEARGDYLLLYHDDDQIDSDFVETCMKAANYRSDAGLIVTGSRVIDTEGRQVRSKENMADGMSDDEFMLLWYKKGVHLFLCNCLFGTEALRRAGGFLQKYDTFDDVAAEFLAMSIQGRIDVREVKAGMREHAGSETSSTDLGRWCKSALALLRLAAELAPDLAPELQKTGRRTSADRNYRYAADNPGFFKRVAGYVTVYRHFRVWPGRYWFGKLFLK